MSDRDREERKPRHYRVTASGQVQVDPGALARSPAVQEMQRLASELVRRNRGGGDRERPRDPARVPAEEIQVECHPDRPYDHLEAVVRGGTLVILGIPDQLRLLPEDQEETFGHNCDAMGCGSSHVLFRVDLRAFLAEREREWAERADRSSDLTLKMAGRLFAAQRSLKAFVTFHQGHVLPPELVRVMAEARAAIQEDHGQPLDSDAPSGATAILDAPCLWCDYSGERYWQRRSHAEHCPWHAVAGLEQRSERVEDEVAKALARARETVYQAGQIAALRGALEFTDRRIMEVWGEDDERAIGYEGSDVQARIGAALATNAGREEAEVLRAAKEHVELATSQTALCLKEAVDALREARGGKEEG